MTETKRPPSAPTPEGPRPKPLTTEEIIALGVAAANAAPPLSNRNAGFYATREKWAAQLHPAPRAVFERTLDEADTLIAQGWALRRAAYAYAELNGARRGQRRRASTARPALEHPAVDAVPAADAPERSEGAEP
jgi:hypothetical protein